MLAAVPIVKSIFKGLKPVKAPKLKLPEIAIEDADFVTESTGTAYLLVELLDEKNNVINPEVAKLYVNSQGVWTPIGTSTDQLVNLGNECTQSGILRFSIVNDTDYNVWFDDFEITHKQSDDKINVTSWTDYYPYGKVAKTSCPLNGAYRYGYQGEFAEKEEEWNSFELRQYDSEIGRWLSTDPYGQYWSPYMAMGNDPVNEVDPNGGWAGLSPDAMTYLSNAVSYWNSYHLDEVVVTPDTDYLSGILDFSYGFVNAYNSNQTLGLIERDVRSAEYNQNIARGALAADIVNLAQSLVEIESGMTSAGGGAALSVTGIGAVAGVPIAAGGVALAAHGTLVGAYTIGQIRNSVDRVHFAKHKDGGKGSFEKMKQGDNTKINEQATSLFKTYGLNKKQQRDVHDLITGQGYTRKEIESIIREYLKLD